MLCKEVEVVLEQEGWTPVPEAARLHLAECGSCQSLVEDLTAIVATAHLLPAEVEPPARVWNSLRAQLEAEGIIKSPATQRGSWWHGFADLLRSRVLATAAVGLLIATGIAIQVRQPSTPAETRNFYADTYADTATNLNADEANLTNMQLVGDSAVDVSLRQNLDIVDRFIADCERRVKEEPRDELAREYLSGAYQQKAELLSAMMERGRSVN
jgi:hypothetical protein